MLDVGAVCGMSFNPALVAAVLEEKRVRVLRELAEIERRHGLVRGDAGQTHFDQNQIQEVLYADLPPDLRCEYHSLLAEAYEGDDAHFLALHHLRGSRPERGLEYVDPALDELLAGYRNEAAFELMDLALEHLEGRERAKLLLRKAGRLDVVGDYAAAVPVASEAFELAKGEEDSLLLKALGLMGGAIRRVGRRDEAEATAREKLELAKGLGDRKHEAAALIALSSLAKKPDEGLSHADRALEIYRELEDRRGQAAALNTKGLALQHLHRYPEARECLERTLEVARETRNRNLEGGCLVNLGLAYQYMGRLDDAERCFEEGRAVLREVGNRAWEGTAITNLGNVYADRGLITKALAMKKRNLALKMEVGERPAEAGANGRGAAVRGAKREPRSGTRR
jgi:tetratricopeptide (TPR) repeat protein